MRGRLAEALAAGRFAVTAELGPPRGSGTEKLAAKARTLRPWVDAVNLTDNQGAAVRLSSWAASVVAMREGLEPVMQLVCRDRNRMALQSDLLGAAALGIPNVLLLTGDHPTQGDHPGAKPVYDLDAVQLVRTASILRDEGRLLSGQELRGSPDWLIGAVENPFAPPQRFRAARLAKKAAAGAEFVQTQYVFDLPAFEAWLAQLDDLGVTSRCRVIAGVGPVRSLRMLDRLGEIPGIHVPEDVERRLRAVPPERVGAEGVAVCAEIVSALRELPGVAGVHVMAFGWEDIVPEVLERAGLAPRETAVAEPTAAPSRV